jgi:hypothetical protein
LYPVRNRAGVEHGVLRFNPELHEILFQVKVPWDCLSKPHVIAHLFYVNFSADALARGRKHSKP